MQAESNFINRDFRTHLYNGVILKINSKKNAVNQVLVTDEFVYLMMPGLCLAQMLKIIGGFEGY